MITNKKILLLTITKNLTDSKALFGARRSEQLPLASLSAYLKSSGFEAIILPGDSTEKDIIASIETHRPFAIGFSVYTYALKTSLHLAQIAKNKSKELGDELITVFGGYHPSNLPEAVAQHEAVDFVVKGEGEITFKELITTSYNKKSPESIPGLFYYKDNRLVRTPDRKRILCLESLPFPDRTPLKNQQPKRGELTYPPPSEQVRSAQAIYSRGCPFACSFCDSKNTWGQTITYRSPKSVADEFSSLHQEYKTNLIIFLDLTFNADKKKVIALCAELIKRDLPIHWTAMVRADLLDEKTLSSMAKAKCSKINLGIESFITNQAISLKDNYQTHEKKLLDTLTKANNLGILIRAFLAIGFLNETEETILTASKLLQRYPIDELRVTIATPFPGTEFWKNCLNKKLIKENPNWDNFTTEQLVFQHPHFTNDSLITLRNNLVKNYFLSNTYKEHIFNKIEKFPHLRKSWIEFLTFLIEKEYNIFKKDSESIRRVINKLQNS